MSRTFRPFYFYSSWMRVLTSLSIAQQACWTTFQTVKKERKRIKCQWLQFPVWVAVRVEEEDLAPQAHPRCRTPYGMQYDTISECIIWMSACSMDISTCSFWILLSNGNFASHCWHMGRKPLRQGGELRIETDITSNEQIFGKCKEYYLKVGKCNLCKYKTGVATSAYVCLCYKYFSISVQMAYLISLSWGYRLHFYLTVCKCNDQSKIW